MLLVVSISFVISACAPRHTRSQPPRQVDVAKGGIQPISVSTEFAPPGDELSSLFSAIQQHESWDMIEYGQILGRGYFYHGVGAYLLLIERGVLERNLADLHAQTQEPGFDALLSYIQRGFEPEECFGEWEILGKGDVRGHMGPTGNIGYEFLLYDAIASAILDGDAFLMDKETGNVLDRIFVGRWHLLGDVGGRLFTDADGRKIFQSFSY